MHALNTKIYNQHINSLICIDGIDARSIRFYFFFCLAFIFILLFFFDRGGSVYGTAVK